MGKGEIPVHRCPRSVTGLSNLLPYFIAYKNSGNLAWPDGRGRYYQPIKLVITFDILNYYFNKFEPKIEIPHGKKN